MCYPSIRSERNGYEAYYCIFISPCDGLLLFMLADVAQRMYHKVINLLPRVVKDIDGTDVTIPKDITKVADLWHANNQVVLMLGGADKIERLPTTSVQGLPWFAKVYPRIKEIPAPVKGTDVNGRNQN